MSKLIAAICCLTIYFAGIYYLIQPTPIVPDLADSVRSDEPGDTWQHPDQKAFYTRRQTRSDILGELQNKFSLSTSFTRYFSYRLNYRPEEVGELVRDQIKSYYLEEVVHQLRESLFINVLDPIRSPLIDDADRESQKMYFRGIFYPVKVTLRPVFSEALPRLFIWTLIFPSTLAVFLSLKRSFYGDPD